MGWYYTCGKSRAGLIQDLTDASEREGWAILRHCARGNVLWSVWEREADGLRVILCDLMRPSPDGWGHKPMEAAMHPYYYTCPLSYLDMVPVECEEWRAGVRQYHESKRKAVRV